MNGASIVQSDAIVQITDKQEILVCVLGLGLADKKKENKDKTPLVLFNDFRSINFHFFRNVIR